MFDAVHRFFFGDDVFISYSRRDGSEYASALANKLAGLGFSCRFDQWGTVPGVNVPEEMLSSLKRSSVMVVVGTLATVESLAVRSEIEAFSPTRRPIIPIILHHGVRDATWFKALEGLAISIETVAAESKLIPSENIVERIRNSTQFTRRNDRLYRSAIAAGLILAVLVVASVLATVRAGRARRLELEERGRTAQSIELQARSEARAARADQDAKLSEEEKQKAISDESMARAAANVAMKNLSNVKRQAKTISAENLLRLGSIWSSKDPAVSIRLIQRAGTLDSSLDARPVLLDAVHSNPVWNRFPSEIQFEDKSSFLPNFEEMKQAFVTTPDLQFVLMQERSHQNHLELLKVDSGEKVRDFWLEPGESLVDEAPYARQLVLLKTGTSEGTFRFRVLDFRDLVAPGKPVEQAKFQGLRGLSCTPDGWPCVALEPSGLVKLYRSKDSQLIIESNADRPAERFYLNESGRALVAITHNGEMRWHATSDDWNHFETRSLDTRAGRWYNFEPMLPWIRWGPRPEDLLIAEPSWTGDQETYATDVSSPLHLDLYALDIKTGSRTSLKQTIPLANGLARPVFEVGNEGTRIMWGGQPGGDVEVFTLNWDRKDRTKPASISNKGRSLLRPQIGRDAGVDTLSAAISPNGQFGLISYDTRGLSGAIRLWTPRGLELP